MNNSVKKNIKIQQALFFFLKRTFNISLLIMMLIKMRLLVLLILGLYGLACKYGIIFQISGYNWMKNCMF